MNLPCIDRGSLLIKSSVFIVMMFLAVPASVAQTLGDGGKRAEIQVTATTTPAPVQDDHVALKNILKIYEEAAAKGQPDLLKPYLDPEFTGVMVTGDEVSGQGNSLNEFWARMQNYLGQGGKYQMTATLAGPATITGNVAVAHGTTDETAIKDGKTYQFKGLWTAVCRKNNGEWKIYRVHASMYPISNPFVGEMVKYTKIVSAGVGGVAGLVVGFGLAALFRKGKAPAQ